MNLINNLAYKSHKTNRPSEDLMYCFLNRGELILYYEFEGKFYVVNHTDFNKDYDDLAPNYIQLNNNIKLTVKSLLNKNITDYNTNYITQNDLQKKFKETYLNLFPEWFIGV